MTGLPIIFLIGFTAAALAVWVTASLRFSGRRSLIGRCLEGLIRILSGGAALYLLMELLARGFTLSTPWPLPWLALAGSAAVEWVRAFSGLERRAVPPRTARLLLAFRILIVLILLLILLQPVRIWENRRTVRREVAVLFDGSASMQVPDSGMSPGEKLRLAGQLGIPGTERKIRLEQTAASLEQVRQELGAAADELAAAQGTGAETVRRTARDSALRRRLVQAARHSKEALDVFESPAATALLTGASRARLTGLSAALRREAVDAIPAVVSILDITATNKVPESALAGAREAQERLRRSATALADQGVQFQELALLADDALARSMTGTVAQAMEAAARGRRCDLAVSLWNSRLMTDDGKPGRDSLAGSLEKQYGVKPFIFEGQLAPVDKALFATNPASLFSAGAEKGTDLAAALDSLAQAFPPAGLAGVLIFTDGRHQAPSSVDAAAKPFQLKNVPLIPVAMGGWLKAPVDAGLSGLEAPESARTNDRVTVSAWLKADGLRGTNLQIRLFRDSLCVATQAVIASSESFRQKLALADQPISNGLYRYRLEVDSFTNEVTVSNNQASVPVMVTDSQLRMLLVESRPRWEFRYLKNLFSGRDRSVRLQHVLLEPDTIDGLPPQAPIPASASRPEAEVESTALPVSPEEWLKFDVIVLGDIAPAVFTNNELVVLDRFVKQRGGLLIAVAAHRAMPRAWRDTSLAALLPVTVAEAPVPWLGSPDEAFRIQLTAEGRAHPWIRLAADAAENETTWNTLPAVYWRHPVQSVKAGASVLLYARPESADGTASRFRVSETLPDEESLRRAKAFEESHALLALQSIGLGRVVFFAFDQTWRLRYWVGDAWHHTLWGQIAREGGAGSLTAGDVRSRLGASRLRYEPGQPVVVQARLLKPDFSPRTDSGPDVEIFKDNRSVTRGELAPVPGRAGRYERAFGVLPEGDYRAVLTDGTNRVETGFSVVPEKGSELAELAADRGLLSRLADQTGGKVIEAWRLEDAAAWLKAPVETTVERRQWDAWDSPWLFGLVMLLAGAEWLVRKRAGLI